MAGRRGGYGILALCLLLAALTGCGGTPDTARADTQRLLDRRAAAVLDRDESAYLATGARTQFDNLRHMPLASWAYRLTAFHRDGDRATAEAVLGYRIDPRERGAVQVARTLGLTRGAHGWRIVSEEPADGSAEQLWDQGRVHAVRGDHSLVLGVGRAGTGLRRYADLADRAVPAASSAWGGDWPRRVVVLVPESLDAMAALLGGSAPSYRGIAAVTTGEAGGSTPTGTDRIIVNPDAYEALGDLGRQVVLTHETAHVATRGSTTAATPLWLSEGFADWAGYRGTGRTAAEAAPELRRAVAAGEVPDRLPADEDFGFDRDGSGLARAYEGGWAACRLVAEEWGEDRLRAFYRSVGSAGDRAGAVAGAMRDVLGTTPEEFTERWRRYLVAELG